ncbi:MAG: uroporphyrinogen decarboxylase family protein [Clostridiaceae bacterium]|nr:uroporphyrinogen decarboxylase family protein [Clostridiaceae bacterium]
MSEYAPSVQKMHDFYALKPDAPIYQKEFGYYCMDRWILEGHVLPESETPDRAAYLRKLFSFDEPALSTISGLGGCEASLFPRFEVKVLEDRGQYELVQDFAGRHVLYFKGRRNGFMPEYVDHPVKDRKSFEEKILWRMNPHTPGRDALTVSQVDAAAQNCKQGFPVRQYIVGGYMYLRSLMGPEGLLYMFYDDPDLIHACMRAWFDLADAVMTTHQKSVAIDEILFDEDICYKNGSLISPDMIREFLLPYYGQLVENAGSRNPNGVKPIVQLATDGYCLDVIPLYQEINCRYVSPFEVAAGQDVVEIGKRFPELLMSGGIDKRVLATTPEEIDRYLDRILPVMRARGGYIPTCDHGVPEEVSFENYMHYRKRMLEYAN